MDGTTPITITGVPKYELQLTRWHTENCDNEDECNCVQDIVWAETTVDWKDCG